MPSLNANENYLQLHVILCHLYTQLVLHFFPFFSFVCLSVLIPDTGRFMAISQMRILESVVIQF